MNRPDHLTVIDLSEAVASYGAPQVTISYKVTKECMVPEEDLELVKSALICSLQHISKHGGFRHTIGIEPYDTIRGLCQKYDVNIENEEDRSNFISTMVEAFFG